MARPPSGWNWSRTRSTKGVEASNSRAPKGATEVENPLFAAAGLMALVGAVGHAVVGHRSVLANIADRAARHAAFLFLHQGTLLMAGSGVALLLAAVAPRTAGLAAVSLFAAALFSGNFLVFLISSVIMNRAALSTLAPQAAFAILCVGFILAGVGVLRL